jgi:uncharacterized membrane protein YqjE
MTKERDKNHVSFWFWMLAIFITALPCIGVVMVIVWAFIGENETRKNYFRALIAWFLICAAICGGVLMLGFWPQIQKQVQLWLHQFR